MALDKSEKFNMRVSPEFMETIDEWRRHQPDIPPRAEAIRRLVALGMNYEALEALFIELVQYFGDYVLNGQLSSEATDGFISIIEKIRPNTDELGKLYNSVALPIIQAPEADDAIGAANIAADNFEATRPSQHVIGPAAKPSQKG